MVLVIDNECQIVPKTNKTRNLQYKINRGRTQNYDSIWFLRSFAYKQQGGDFIEQLVGDYKGMQKYKNKDDEAEKKKNRMQIKFNSINLIHQTNANQIIIVIMNDVQCESSVKCIRDSSIESIPKLFEITSQVGKSSKQYVIKF